MLDILWKAVITGIFAGIILWLSESRLSFLAGLLIFFPIISLPTFFFMGYSGHLDKMRESIMWSLWSIPVWVGFAGSLYYFSSRMKIIPSICLSLFIWFLGASVLVWWKR